jgi:hypothetical protein
VDKIPETPHLLAEELRAHRPGDENEKLIAIRKAFFRAMK